MVFWVSSGFFVSHKLINGIRDFGMNSQRNATLDGTVSGPQGTRNTSNQMWKYLHNLPYTKGVEQGCYFPVAMELADHYHILYFRDMGNHCVFAFEFRWNLICNRKKEYRPTVRPSDRPTAHPSVRPPSPSTTTTNKNRNARVSPQLFKETFRGNFFARFSRFQSSVDHWQQLLL